MLAVQNPHNPGQVVQKAKAKQRTLILRVVILAHMLAQKRRAPPLAIGQARGIDRDDHRATSM
jgi:hypothetical protein